MVLPGASGAAGGEEVFPGAAGSASDGAGAGCLDATSDGPPAVGEVCGVVASVGVLALGADGSGAASGVTPAVDVAAPFDGRSVAWGAGFEATSIGVAGAVGAEVVYSGAVFAGESDGSFEDSSLLPVADCR